MIHRFDTIDSTNRYAKELADHGAPHGTVVIAAHQTGGRGRMGRCFHSPAGGLYLSLLLRPQCQARQLMHLTCAAAVAACNAIETIHGFRPGIKWTNDIVYKTQKIGGILTELGFTGSNLDYAIIGIGINCNQRQSDFPDDLQVIATSILEATGRKVDLPALENALIDSLVRISDSIASNKASIIAQYRQNCVTLGKQVYLHESGSNRLAAALDVDENGGLIVRLEDGSIKTIASGEVSTRGLYGYL